MTVRPVPWSLVVGSTLTGVPARVLAVSGLAVGVTVIRTVAEAVRAWLSVIVYPKESTPENPASGTYTYVPSGFTVTDPCPGLVFEVTEIALPVSLPNTPEAIVNVTPAAVTALSSAAVGAAGLTVNVTVEDVVAPEESLIVYGTVTVPMNPTGGVYTTEPPTTEVEPCPAGGEPTDTTDNPDPTSLTLGSTDAE